MLALFHDKKCCNCFNLFPCILWDFIVLGLILSWWRLKLNLRSVHFASSLREIREKGSHEKGMREAHDPSYIIFYPCSYLIFFPPPPFLLIHLSIRDKNGESIPVSIIISIWFMCIILGGESHRGDVYTKGKKTSFWENHVLFLFYIMLVFSLFYGALSYF